MEKILQRLFLSLSELPVLSRSKDALRQVVSCQTNEEANDLAHYLHGLQAIQISTGCCPNEICPCKRDYTQTVSHHRMYRVHKGDFPCHLKLFVSFVLFVVVLKPMETEAWTKKGFLLWTMNLIWLKL